MNKTSFDLGLEKGLEKGRVDLVQQLLSKRFGAVNDSTKQYLLALDPNQICDLTIKIATASKWEETGLPR